MESINYKNLNSTKNKNNEEKYNKFNIDIFDNQKNKQIEKNNNYVSAQQNVKIIDNEKEEDNEIIIELEIKNNNDKEINILCDKNQLIEDNKNNEKYYKENNIESFKIFDYFNKENTKLYLNNNEVSFKYKLKLNKIGINKIKIISKVKLLSLSSMFYYCNKINNIKFIKINTNNVINIIFMFNKYNNLIILSI